MNQRYWNGHQWKDLPAIEAIAGDAVAEVSVEAPVAIAAAAPVEPQTAAAPARVATMVPTHAEYGDVFTAAAAAEQPKVDG